MSMVQNLPTAETYQKELQYMPWGILISEVIEYVVQSAPLGATVLDLLCGTGNLIHQISKRRPDMHFTGVDLEPEYVAYAKNQNDRANFLVGDAFSWDNGQKFDVVLCTAGLHHIEHKKQKKFIEKISNSIAAGGFAIVGDPYIDSYSNETERKIAAAKLGVEYLIETIRNGASDDVIRAATSLIDNDVFLVEFKDSIKNVEPYFRDYFSTVIKHKTWPAQNTEYGDYWFLLRKS